ncbi:PREDICTED: uncharacterized protein LOC109163568 [Ipomoea nil]|uniref:uncharacterized protein LOC109163568 n=1 Tax=Ipomoea nil TaxID=35883 RepID=UPI0009013DB9|nr:PREDICTED: uncharacterized protein LOC109163568 [Ipomoea nil]
MGVKVATTCLHWSQHSVPHSPPHPHVHAAMISSLPKRRGFVSGERSVVCRFVHRLERSAFLGAPPTTTKLSRSRSCEFLKPPAQTTIRRACSASLEDSFSDEEFTRRIEELALSFQRWDDEETLNSSSSDGEEEEFVTGSSEAACRSSDECTNGGMFLENQKFHDQIEPPDWARREEIMRKANSMDFPLSLRIIKSKKQWQDGLTEVGESTYCSVKKAFSNMVFIIRELHSYSLKMREILFYEDLQEILVRVQKDLNASFVWLFQQVFSHTPSLMMSVMILLANFSVYSMASSSAFAATPPLEAYTVATTEEISMVEDRSDVNQKFDFSASRTFSVSSSNGKSVSIGGNNGGGGKFRPVAGGTDGDGRFDGAIVVDGTSSVGNSTSTGEEEAVSGEEEAVSGEEELRLWNSIEDEANKMQSELRDEALDHETMMRFVSPINAKMESDDCVDYFRTELLYQTGIAQEPNNALLLANYAQFLYLVGQDYDRADEYFKRAAEVEHKDAEALNKYATFLWKARNDLWAAEETFQAAIDAEPTNSFYAANYAQFLWNTGGEDTCFPLDSLDENDDI